MKIETTNDNPLLLWQAYDSDTLDGATDAGRLGRMRGEGRTEREALVDLLEQLDEYWDEKCEGLKKGISEGTHRWIPVSDRLPANAEHVLIATAMWADAHDAIRREGGWMNLSMDCEHLDSDEVGVTHWHVKPRSPHDMRPVTGGVVEAASKLLTALHTEKRNIPANVHHAMDALSDAISAGTATSGLCAIKSRDGKLEYSPREVTAEPPRCQNCGLQYHDDENGVWWHPVDPCVHSGERFAQRRESVEIVHHGWKEEIICDEGHKWIAHSSSNVNGLPGELRCERCGSIGKRNERSGTL